MKNLRQVRYWALSDQGQGNCRSSNGFPFTTIKNVSSKHSTFVQTRKLILNVYVHLILIYNIYINIVMLE